MSTIKSSSEHLVLNADGASKDIKFQANGVEKASISSAGAFTSTSIDATKLSGTVPNFTSTGIDDNATSTAITIDASENVKLAGNVSIGGEVLEPWNTTWDAIQLGTGGFVAAQNNAPTLELGSNYYRDAGAADFISRSGTSGASQVYLYDGQVKILTAPDTAADAAITWNTAMTIDNTGAIQNQKWYDETASAAGNANITSYGQIKRSTSSIKYKKDVETMEDSYADAILTMRPVWYHSKCKGDPENYGYWGLIAEEVAAIDPRLVHWKDVEHTDVLNEETGETEKVFTPLAEPEAEGVQYDRIIPHLINLLKRQDTTIKSLEARVTALEL